MTMLGRGEIERRLGFHPANDRTGPAHDIARATVKLAANLLDQLVPPGREAALVQSELEAALQRANQAIACNAGPEWTVPMIDVADLVDELLELVEGPQHTRGGPVGGGGPVAGPGGGDISATEPVSAPDGLDRAESGPVAPVDGAERVLRGDCLERVPGAAATRCELVAGHDGEHRRDSVVWS